MIVSKIIVWLLAALSISCSATSVTLPVLQGIILFRIISLHYKGYYITDLYGSNSIDFTSLASSWTITNPRTSASAIYTCDTTILLGGPSIVQTGTIFTRTYQSLSIHSYITFQIDMAIIDQWTSSDQVSLKLDGNTIATYSPIDITSGAYSANFCGDSTYQDYLTYKISGQQAHTNNQLTLAIALSISSSTASFGLRDVMISLGSTSTAGYVGTTCHRVWGGSSWPCGCGYTAYINSGYCPGCDGSCKTCFGGTSSQCFGCSDGLSFDGTSCGSCPSNCISCSSSTQCTRCSDGYFLYWDGTCISSCPPPYVSAGDGSYKECHTPCESSGTYMVWDYSCSSTCETPYVPVVINNAKFCNYPCNVASGEYLFWDGSCQSSCSNYPRTDNGYKFCDVCQPGYYMYPDMSCLPTCPSPLKIHTNINSHFCSFPCANHNKYYDLRNLECLSSCDYPNTLLTGNICQLDLSGSDAKQAAAVSGTLNKADTAMSAATTIVGLVDFANPDAFCAVGLQKMLQYIKFMKITYPPKLQAILDKQESDTLAKYIPAIPTSLSKDLPLHSIPTNFKKYKLHSSFLVNFWTLFLILCSIVAAVAIICMLTYCFKKINIIYTVCAKVKHALKWNLALMQFITYYSSIVLFTSLEVRTTKFDGFSPVFSFIVCFIINVVGIFVIVRMFIVLRDRRRHNTTIGGHNQSQGAPPVENKWKDYEVLYKTYKENSFSEQAFLPLFVTRIYLFNVIIAYLFEYPLVQALLITLLNLVTLIYLGAKRSLKENTVLFKYAGQEMIIFIINVCVLALAILDKLKLTLTKSRNMLGDVIIGCNIAFTAVAMAYLCMKVLVLLFDVFKMLRNRNQKVSPIRAPESPMIDDEPSSEIVLREASFVNSSNKPKILVLPLDMSRIKSLGNHQEMDTTAPNIARSSRIVNIKSPISRIRRSSVDNNSTFKNTHPYRLESSMEGNCNTLKTGNYINVGGDTSHDFDISVDKSELNPEDLREKKSFRLKGYWEKTKSISRGTNVPEGTKFDRITVPSGLYSSKGNN